jgi:hypothetical protein
MIALHLLRRGQLEEKRTSTLSKEWRKRSCATDDEGDHLIRLLQLNKSSASPHQIKGNLQRKCVSL